MKITQQSFADAVMTHVYGNPTTLDPNQHETHVPDHWTYRAESRAMSGMICLVNHGMFDRVYKRTVILPRVWDSFCEQFFSPEARLLMRLYRECQQPSWLIWNPKETNRDDSPMTGHFWTRKHQDHTYAALLEQLRDRGLTTKPTRTYTQDGNTIGIKLPDHVIDFPGSYRTLELMMNELMGDYVYQADIPRNVRLYGDSKPVLHMIADVVDSENDELRALVASKTSPTPKEQQVVYVLSESRRGKLITRRVGQMRISVLEIAYGSVAGAIHSDMNYLVPNELSPDEKQSYDCSEYNWIHHCSEIIKKCPAVAGMLAIIA
ncbi:MAG: hypothetical protein Q8R40_02890 [bacterium]|nr:hypothetical protein [bacterium]